MAAVDLTDNLEVSDPTVEVVVVTATDGETYTSRKFGSIRSVQASIMEDAGTLTIPLSCAVSGGVVTIHCTGLSDLKVAPEIRGKK